jgi:hypothetical protein
LLLRVVVRIKPRRREAGSGVIYFKLRGQGLKFEISRVGTHLEEHDAGFEQKKYFGLFCVKCF